jgi:hypothetical protein
MPRHDATRAGLRMSKGRAEGDRPVMLILPGRRVYTGPIRAAGPGIRYRAAPAGAMNEPTTNACRLGAIPVPIRSAGESRTVAVHMARVWSERNAHARGGGPGPCLVRRHHPSVSALRATGGNGAPARSYATPPRSGRMQHSSDPKKLGPHALTIASVDGDRPAGEHSSPGGGSHCLLYMCSVYVHMRTWLGWQYHEPPPHVLPSYQSSARHVDEWQWWRASITVRRR